MHKLVVFTVLLGSLALSFNSHQPVVSPPAQPNILWITCEDMSYHLSSFGDKEVKKPNLDQLAAFGIRTYIPQRGFAYPAGRPSLQVCTRILLAPSMGK